MFQAARAGWLGELFEVHAVMSKTIDSASRQQLAQYRGGSMFELGCHMIDALVALLGKPDRVTAYVRRTRANQDDLADNQIAVFEYPRATATVRSALVEVDGFRRRQFVVCGDRGTIEIMPIEPPRLLLTLAQSQGPYAKGTHEIPLQPLAGRYDGDFLDLAQIIRGEKEPDFGTAHDLVVHEAVLSASGMPVQ
jgi:predicted dehydrogenase